MAGPNKLLTSVHCYYNFVLDVYVFIQMESVL